MMKLNFNSLYQPNTPRADQSFDVTIDNFLRHASIGLSLLTMEQFLQGLIIKNRQTPGHDGITNEHIITARQHCRYICLLFDALLSSLVPCDYCFGVLLPLLKNKHEIHLSAICVEALIRLALSLSRLKERNSAKRVSLRTIEQSTI